MISNRITELLGKELALTAADVQEIRYRLATLPPDEEHEIAPLVWEGVALIVNDGQYKGDAAVPNLDAEPAA